eukprot:TRINITY_DN82360_c0_g1_i1.p1 TRINITY_DN82360_c0_g1~~TRINITY_DN82360_c0_g1_i1.p1  ORF type:complete len:834 (-),score=167.69 TRINITY_DN82360_c0_g1_i1:392-2797(-)
MTAMGLLASVGGLVGFATFMRFQADIQFQRDVLLAAQTYIVKPLKQSTQFSAFVRKTENRKAITLHKTELGRSYSYAKRGELGMVFRVEDGEIHLAGLMPDSPLRGTAIPGWKLATLNGRRLQARTEREVQDVFTQARLPMKLVFSAPAKTKEQKEQEAKGRAGLGPSFEDDKKMFVVMMGVMNSFTQVSQFDFKWPDTFTRLAELASQLSFNLNFFKPECSVATPYVQSWLGFLAIPYLMMIPLFMSYFLATVVTLFGLVGEARLVKKDLLTGAFARCCCMATIIFLPFHLDKLLVPFACVELGGGVAVIGEAPDIPCDSTDPTYQFMFSVSSLGFLMFGTFYSFLAWCVYKSFYWQIGCLERDRMPFYVAMVEVSVMGQRGYVPEVRTRVMENICAVKSYDLDKDKMDEREQLLAARDQFAARQRGKQGATKDLKTFSKTFSEKDDDVLKDAKETIQERLAITKAKARFRSKELSPNELDGNIISYGWVFFVNLLIRQLASLAAIKLTKGNLVVIGAGAQMFVFITNITLLIAFKPYKSMAVVKTEGTLLTALFMILWCAVIKNLLINHKNSHLYESIIGRVSLGIDILAISLMICVPFVPAYQVYLLAKKASSLVLGPDAVLNEIYMTQHKRKFDLAKQAENLALSKFTEGTKTAAEEAATKQLLADLAAAMPQLDQTIKRFDEAGLGQSIDKDQQARFMCRLGKMAGKIHEAKLKQKEISIASAEAERLRREADAAAAAAASAAAELEGEEEAEEALLKAQQAEVAAEAAASHLRMTKARHTVAPSKAFKSTPDEDG